MNRYYKSCLVLLLGLLFTTPAMAVEFAFHGDLNNRFSLYSNHSDLYTGAKFEKGVAKIPTIGKETNTSWGDIKYRFWTEAATNDNKVKGVLGVELGAIRFGDSTKGGSFSGDGKNFEIRWAYTQFQIPGAEGKSLVTLGLQPYKVNSFVWAETAMGVKYTADMYELAWMRGNEIFNSTADDDNSSADSFSARVNLKPAEGTKLGLFGLYQLQDPGTVAKATTTIPFDDKTGAPGAPKTTYNNVVDAGKYGLKQMKDVEYNIYTVGVDGGLTSGNIFVNWDAIYQGGEFKNVNFFGVDNSGTLSRTGDFDLSAYLLHADVGMKMGDSKVTFTTWYASGDDNDTDDQFDAFISTDVDRFDSIVLFEGGYTDDNYLTERPYLFNKGMFMNKLAYDRKQNEKTKFGVAVLYMQTAEDIGTEDQVGTEFDAYVSYKLYPNVELALNGGYLVTGDALTQFATADADEDIYRLTSRVRVSF